MNVTDQIKESKAKIAKLEFDLAVEREILLRFQAMQGDNQKATQVESRPIIPDSVVPHIQTVLKAKGKPMKVGQLLRVIEQQGIKLEGKTEPKRLIQSALNRRDDLFERVSRGLYQLKREEQTLTGET